MRTLCSTLFLCGTAGALTGAAFVVLLKSLGNDHLPQSVTIWLASSIYAIPCVANSLFAILIQRNRHQLGWLLILPATWWIPYRDFRLDGVLVSIAAGATWLGGCFGFIVAKICESRTSRCNGRNSNQ